MARNFTAEEAEEWDRTVAANGTTGQVSIAELEAAV
jgi:hypothetical protein